MRPKMSDASPSSRSRSRPTIVSQITSRSNRACSVPPRPTSTIDPRLAARRRAASRHSYAKSTYACSDSRSGGRAKPSAVLVRGTGHSAGRPLPSEPSRARRPVADFRPRVRGREHGSVGSIGLVLGAGGVVGGAYHAGALAALAEAASWDARSADVIVGTSAGSIAGASLRAGLSGADQFARATRGELSAEGARIIGDLPPITEIPTRPPFPRGLPLPASPQLAATALLPPWRARPHAALAGLLPAGSVPTAPIGDRIRSLFDTPWPEHALWICALRLRDG